MLSCTLTRDMGPGSWFKDGVKVLSPPFTNMFGVRTERRGGERRRGEKAGFSLLFSSYVHPGSLNNQGLGVFTIHWTELMSLLLTPSPHLSLSCRCPKCLLSPAPVEFSGPLRPDTNAIFSAHAGGISQLWDGHLSSILAAISGKHVTVLQSWGLAPVRPGFPCTYVTSGSIYRLGKVHALP